VLIALDGSPAAATVLALARTVTAQLGATLGILHVTATPVTEAIVRQQVGAAGSDLAALPLHHEIGEAAREIVRRAQDPAVALVILTTHGHTIAPGHPLGRVATAVIARATRPVLLARPAAASTGQVTPLRRLLLPLDGAPSTASTLAPIGTLAAQLGAAVDVLYVAGTDRTPPVEPGTFGAPRFIDQPQHEWPQWATEVVGRLYACCAGWPERVPVRVFLEHGPIGAAITRFAAAGQYDAIVLVRSSRFEPERAPVLRAVLHHTPCPVLLVGADTA
jgi:nucleotide-binding universal stress UspA family protein